MGVCEFQALQQKLESLSPVQIVSGIYVNLLVQTTQLKCLQLADIPQN